MFNRDGYAPCSGDTMPIREVTRALDAKKNRFLTVEYYKKDGTLAQVNGQLNPSSRFTGGAKGEAASATLANQGRVYVGRPQKDSKGRFKSASFCVERVKAIR